MRAYWNTWGESVTGMKFRLRKRWWGLDVAIVTGDSFSDASRCADELWCLLCTCAVVFPPENHSRWSWCCEMMSQWSLLLFWEGSLKGEYTQTSGAVIWVSGTEWWGLLISHRPSTPAILVPLVEQSITRKNYVFYLSICMYPDLFGELFSQYDFSCLTVSQVGHYLHPLEPSIEQGKDHNPLAADCEGGINH